MYIRPELIQNLTSTLTMLAALIQMPGPPRNPVPTWSKKQGHF